jgi:hypothetical protein
MLGDVLGYTGSGFMDTATPDVTGTFHNVVDIFIGFGSDVFIFIALVAVVLMFAFYFGRDRLLPLMAGIFVAIPLYTNFPFMSTLGGNAYFSIGLYLLLAFAGMLAFSGLAGFISSSGMGFLKMAALAALISALLLAIGINVLPLKEVCTFSPPTLALFTVNNAFFWWLAAPVVGAFLFGK